MEQKIENNLDFKKKFINFFLLHKKKVYISLLSLLVIIFSSFFIKYKDEKKNIINSEKFIKAGLYLASNNKSDAKALYEEIILSKNQFYSILALNTIIEKELVLDKNKILNYFKVLEKTISSSENSDLIKFKKALYLIKTSDIKEGNDILKSLIKNNSTLKPLAKELIQ